MGTGGLGGSYGRYVPSVSTSPYEQIYNKYSYGKGARPYGPVLVHASHSSASYGPASYTPTPYGPPSYDPAPVTGMHVPEPYTPALHAPASYELAPYAPSSYEPPSIS